MEELSQYLKSERLRRGLSLQDVARESGISISLLKALEQGRFLDIGPPSLVLSHLSAYSRALGESQLPSTHTEATDPVPNIATSPTPPQSQGNHLPVKKNWVRRLGALFVIGLVVLGVCYHLGWLSRPDRGHSNSQLSQTGISPQSPVQSETPSDAPILEDAKRAAVKPSHDAEDQSSPSSPGADLMPQQEEEQEPPATSATPSVASAEENVSSQPMSLHHRFEIEAFQPSWVEVKNNGRKSEGVLLHSGEKRQWQVVHEVQVLVGNAGGVQIKWDGAAVNLGGRPGQVLRFRLPHPDLTGKSS